MAWIILIISAIFEAIWASALGLSAGFTKLVPSIIFFVANILSILGLARAIKEIPIGTAYAVWTAVGTALTVVTAMLIGNEPFSVSKILFLTGILACVIGLKLTANTEKQRETASAAE
ncbi:multidrug efflux SMR transporter [Arcanobacterium hippocoleae]